MVVKLFQLIILVSGTIYDTAVWWSLVAKLTALGTCVRVTVTLCILHNMQYIAYRFI